MPDGFMIRLVGAHRPRGVGAAVSRRTSISMRQPIADEVIDETWDRLMSPDPAFHSRPLRGRWRANAWSASPISSSIVRRGRSRCYCYLEDLFVDPGRPGQAGIGRSLIEAVYAEADRRGATRTYWATQEFNYRARGLYDQLATKSPFIQYRR